MIESGANAQVKKIKKIKNSARFRREQRMFVVEGWKMLGEAIRHGLVREIFISENAVPEWKKRAYSLDCPVMTVSSPLFQELSDTVTPQGVLALTEMPVYELHEMAAPRDAALLILENIQDPGNLGTMMRTLEGAGMSGIVLGKGCVDILNPKVVRATMGSLFRVPFFLSDQLAADVKELKSKGFTMYAAHLAGKQHYMGIGGRGKTGILIGNEANGLSEEISGLADCLVKIPMEGELESLNAAVSAALLMYELYRNRQ